MRLAIGQVVELVGPDHPLAGGGHLLGDAAGDMHVIARVA